MLYLSYQLALFQQDIYFTFVCIITVPKDMNKTLTFQLKTGYNGVITFRVIFSEVLETHLLTGALDKQFVCFRKIKYRIGKEILKIIIKTSQNYRKVEIF